MGFDYFTIFSGSYVIRDIAKCWFLFIGKYINDLPEVLLELCVFYICFLGDFNF